jgi:hypothetical protein
MTMNATTVVTKGRTEFKTARRVNEALTAAAEKRALVWMAQRAPDWVTSDGLTLLGLGAQVAAGVCYGLARWDRRALLLVMVCVALNWLGDSLVLSSESYLATHTLGRFQLSQGIFGPTEIRILMIAGVSAALRSPWATVFGHRMLLFDLGGAIAAVTMLAMAIGVAVRHTAELYRQEPLP